MQPHSTVASALPKARSSPLLALAVGLTVLDGVATFAWVNSGLAVEGNPWLAVLVETWGPGPAMALRVTFGVALLWLLATLEQRTPLARRGLVAACGGLLLVGLWHTWGLVLVA